MTPLQAFVLGDGTTLGTGLLPTEGHREKRGALLSAVCICQAVLHLSVPAWGPTTHPGACTFSATLFKQTALGFSLTWAPSRASHPASIPTLPGKAPGAQPAPLASLCSSQHPQASLSPCEGQVLQVTLRSCEELIRREGSCSCITDGISEAAAGHPHQKEAGSGV